MNNVQDMKEPDWNNEHDLDKYNFVVKPGTPDAEERIVKFIPEEHIQQAKAFRSYFFDRYGTDGELTEKHYQMMDDNIEELETELENEDFDQLSDDQVLSTARQFLINLTANDNENARIMGITDEQIEEFRAAAGRFDTACEDEKKAIWLEQKDRVNKASKDLLNTLGPSTKPFVFTPIKKPGDADNN